MDLFDLDMEPEEVLAHPRQQVALQQIEGLIGQLRACSNIEEGYVFQKDLLARLLAVEQDFNALSQVVKRLAVGKSPQAGAPEPPSNRDPNAAATWRLERDICQRIARQYRCVGDALAWRVFGFDRRYILSLCRSQSSGVMAGKLGLPNELEQMEAAYRNGQFALMHDLTNCLRIGDMTVFAGGGPVTRELKKNEDKEERSTPQTRRVKAARLALGGKAPLPGGSPCERLYDLQIPFKAHLKLLADGLGRAVQDGIFTARVPGDRTLLVVDLGGVQRQGWTVDDFHDRLRRRVSAVRRRAHFTVGNEWIIHATSLDSVSRDPLRVPFAAYPFHPALCTRLIGDIATFNMETSGPTLAESLLKAGLNATWTRPASIADLKPGEVVMEISSVSRIPRGRFVEEHTRTLQVRRSELDRYLMELIEQSTWIEAAKSLLSGSRTTGQPWPHYLNEHEVWA
jgi:hypothetical protein